jgi:hypothetical protein
MKFRSMGGLTVKNGRLVNDRPNGVTGISEAAMLKKAVKREKKVSMIADGIIRAEMRENLMGYKDMD